MAELGRPAGGFSFWVFFLEHTLTRILELLSLSSCLPFSHARRLGCREYGVIVPPIAGNRASMASWRPLEHPRVYPIAGSPSFISGRAIRILVLFRLQFQECVPLCLVFVGVLPEARISLPI